MSPLACGSSADPGGSWSWHRDTAMEEAVTAEEEGIDHFDRLPDSVLLAIFNLIEDVKDLGRFCVVSRRFHALVPLVDCVLVRVDCVISDDPSPSSSTVGGGGDKARGVFSHLARIVLGSLVRPLQALGQILGPTSAVASSPRPSPSSSSSSSEVSHHSPAEVLKNFREIRHLRIELPAGELGVDDGVFLNWKAEFGSSLDRCVILGAASVLPSPWVSPTKPSSPNPNPSFQDAFGDDSIGSTTASSFTNGCLKLRLFWTISSLIAASARHYLLQQIVAEHETLERLELTDVDGQGVLTMDRRQLQEFRVKPVSASGNSQRTLVPALGIRLWYAPQLELPGGVVLKGATLVAVHPIEERGREVASAGGCGSPVGSSDQCWISNAFKEPYRSAVSMLVKRRTYCLEMNSF